MYRFHHLAGPLIQFSNEYRTAERAKAKTDFDGGIIFSERPLEADVVFQLQLDKKIGLWSGGLELGLTTLNPDSLDPSVLPRSGTDLKADTWLMTSSSVLHNGAPVRDSYGFDLEKLEKGDMVGVVRTEQGEVIFYVNGISLGVAIPYVPPGVYGVVNLYGKAAMVTLVDDPVMSAREQRLLCCTEDTDLAYDDTTEPQQYSSFPFVSTENNAEHDKLRFHPNKFGPLVKLSNNDRTAERRRPMEEFNNSVVITHRPLQAEELFQVRIDTLIHKWSGSIEFGLITLHPDSFGRDGLQDFPATLTVLGKGTVIMSGNGILHDGKATNSPYSYVNLDQLQEGDRIGVMRRSNGDVVYWFNGESAGVATNVPLVGPIWGCCNLYGMAAKVTIVDRNEREEHNLRVTSRIPQPQPDLSHISDSDELLFHPNCGFHAAVINNGRTAHRPESMNDFNHGVVLTNRPLRPNEIFEVKLDKIVTKWAGSIEIGVTSHSPKSLEYPCTMTNVRSGTWMFTGDGVMHNGQSIIDAYGQSLDKLKIGDCVGVLRKDNGNLHFFVNQVDQGCAAIKVPENVFGVIDLYGQAAQATIVSHSTGSDQIATSDNVNLTSMTPVQIEQGLPTFACGDLRFHHLHGKNARISNNGLTASRPNALGEFNAAIVISSRPLKVDELFEVVIERMVDRWSGNIEAGVTTIKPENLIFPNTMTDLPDSSDTITLMLSGSSIMSGGSTITSRFPTNLDCLTVNSRIGLVKKSDGFLHFFINGEDMGAAPVDLPSDLPIYAVIDLYGQCAQVSITRVGDLSLISGSSFCGNLGFNMGGTGSILLGTDTSHRFAAYHGKNVSLKNNNLTACRARGYNHGLVFSSSILEREETFEVRVQEFSGDKWGGTLAIGVTTWPVPNCSAGNDQEQQSPGSVGGFCTYPRLAALSNSGDENTWYLRDTSVYLNQSLLQDNYSINLNRLCAGDRVGVRVSKDGVLRFLINGEEMGPAANDIPKNVHVVVDLFGSCESVLITSTVKSVAMSNTEGTEGLPRVESLHSMQDEALVQSQVLSEDILPTTSNSLKKLKIGSSHIYTFSVKRSRNVDISNNQLTAQRTSGYQGFVFSQQELQKCKPFEIRIDKTTSKYSGTVMIGTIESNPERLPSFPFNALGFKKSCCLVMDNMVFQNGNKVSELQPSLSLTLLSNGDVVGLMVDSSQNLRLLIGKEEAIIASNVGPKCRALVVLYGVVEQVTILQGQGSSTGEKEENLNTSSRCSLANSHEKIQLTSTMMTLGSPVRASHCPYFDACLRFKSSLCIPEAFILSTEPSLCYCPNCFKEPQVLMQQGDPTSDFLLPLGWVRFPVNIVFDNQTTLVTSTQGMTTSTTSLSNVLTTWNVAYHGLEIFHVREVMDCGILFPADSMEPFPEEGKDEKSDNAELTFSPSIEYASISAFSPTKSFTDSRTRKCHAAKVAFQVLLQPGSYKRGSPSYEVPTHVEKECETFGLDVDKLQWSTKEQGSTHVSALLVKLENFFTD